MGFFSPYVTAETKETRGRHEYSSRQKPLYATVETCTYNGYNINIRFASLFIYFTSRPKLNKAHSKMPFVTFVLVCCLATQEMFDDARLLHDSLIM